MTKKRFNIENFNTEAVHVRLNSPRSLEACRRQGIDPQELGAPDYAIIAAEVQGQQKNASPNVKGIKIPGHVNKKQDDTTEKLIQMRIDFHEGKRQ